MTTVCRASPARVISHKACVFEQLSLKKGQNETNDHDFDNMWTETRVQQHGMTFPWESKADV